MHTVLIFFKSKNILPILFLHIFALVKFQKASFNSNRDMRQNVGLDGRDGGYGDGHQNNTSCRFSKKLVNCNRAITVN